MKHAPHLIQPLVDHLVQQADPSSAQKALLEAGVFSRSELLAMTPDAVSIAYRTLRHVQLMHCSSEELLQTIEKNQACWPTDLSDDFKQGAIS